MATAVCEHTLVTRAQAYVEKLHKQYIEGHKIEQEFEKIRNESQIQKQLEREPKSHIPILSVPRCIQGEYYENKTTIEIVLNSDKIQDNYGERIRHSSFRSSV